MVFSRERRRLLAAAILAIGVPVAACAYVRTRTRALAEHLSETAGVPARIGAVDADLTGTIRLSDLALGDLVSTESIEASVSLDSLLAGELGADELRVAGPRVALAIDRDGDSDLARVVRRFAHAGPARGGGSSRLRRIVVTSGALTARIAEVGELEADGVELVPDAGGVRVITGRVHARGASGRFAGELDFERSAAEVSLPHARFGRVLAVAGAGSISIDGRDMCPAGSTAGGRCGPIDGRDVCPGASTAGGRCGSIDGQRAIVLRDVAVGRLAAGGALEVRAAIDDAGARRTVAMSVAPGDFTIALRGEHVPLAPFAPLAPHALDLADAHATGELIVRRGTGVELRFAGAVDDLRLDHRTIGAQPIAISARAAGTVSVTPDAVALADASLELGAAKWTASGWLRRGSPASGQLDIAVAPAACSDLLAAMPAELRGPLDGMAMTGTFGMRARVAIDLAAPLGAGVTLDAALANECQVSAEPPAADVAALATAKHDAAWVELRRLPGYVPGAFVAAEDARFFDHHGLDPKEIARSLEIDLRDHRLARGGSTISQQLVKNAFLTQRRSLDRKLQEAILTWRLEARLDKKTILERYLNIIELGPHAFGIAAAAQYWFGVSPYELSVRQAAFLAALTSEPQSMSRRVRHAGGLDPDSAARVDVVLRAMRFGGAIDNEGLAVAHEMPMRFAANALKKDE